MFVDEKILTVTAGKGGDGAILFRREKYVPRGGPDGGDGGRGGDVVLVAHANLHTLTHLAHVNKIDAEDGLIGGHATSTGHSGETKVLQVPLGTQVFLVQEDGSEELAYELLDEGQEQLIARGGNGGWGNWHFRSSIQQVPKRANPGQPGEQKRIKLVLKLIADIGLVGLPNAGKSTLLSVVSAAKPKIADYPFTTLEPQLGVATIGAAKDAKTIVIADLPGLIEGASGGRGLGATFLKHVERTHKLLHCIAADTPTTELLAAYKTIRTELTKWSPTLAKKEEIVVLTKSDLVQADELKEKVALLKKHLKQPVHAISAATHTGVQDLLTQLI
jgi:GTP-binding protein